MRILICFLFTLVLVSCTSSKEEISTQPKPEKEEKNEFIKSIEFKTPDDRVTFTMLNIGKYDKNYLQDTKKAILDNYKPLRQYLAEFDLYSEVTVSLKEKGQYNTVLSNALLLEIPIERKKSDKRMLADSLIKLNYYNKGALFLKYGYLWHIHYKFDETPVTEKLARESKAVTALFKNKQYIPMEKLLDPNVIEEKTQENKTVVFLEAVSFTRYLIETYGIEKFVHIFDVEKFDEAVRTTYGKDFKTLEEEWLQQFGR